MFAINARPALLRSCAVVISVLIMTISGTSGQSRDDERKGDSGTGVTPRFDVLDFPSKESIDERTERVVPIAKSDTQLLRGHQVVGLLAGSRAGFFLQVSIGGPGITNAPFPVVEAVRGSDGTTLPIKSWVRFYAPCAVLFYQVTIPFDSAADAVVVSWGSDTVTLNLSPRSAVPDPADDQVDTQ
jgi:hypothetical protein